MEREPERDRAEAEAVRLYLEAIDVPPVPWAAIEARERSLRERRRRRAWTGALVGAAAAAALLVAVSGRALAPTQFAGPAARVTFGSIENGPAKTPGPNAGPAGHSGSATATAFVPALLPVGPVRFEGRTYAIEAVSLAPASVGRLLSGHAPPRSTWRLTPAGRKGAFRVLALFAVRGTPLSAQIAVLGRFGKGPPSLWSARPAVSVSPGLADHGPHA